jgi:BirA family biotin operon repressor/biotin-[acetyl-CoA-carboxylase] ligase
LQGSEVGRHPIENTIQGSYVKESIIGIGLNINATRVSGGLWQTRFFEILKPANNMICRSCKASCSQYLEYRYLQFQHNSPLLHENYLELLYQKGIKAKYQKGQEQLEGVIEDVDDTGRLLMQVQGEQVAYAFKEISFLPPASSS